ncbi:flavodoxin [Pseudoalteromonas umbrosa]|uniref:flavodoxin n=1 Tax=Pseudoalteromonas umbrosa TaxID=3048489 RepID=UPI0024C2F6F7|nr:flavodoxin [Pseudoalteromonas sp. B95]MDK1287522.1 flavodoxin [Pseudoalteromonas sp. B95]
MASITLFVGSVYGNAESLAEQIQTHLNGQGHEARIAAPATLEHVKSAEHALFVSSTTGQGDIPDNLYPLFIQMQAQMPMLTNKSVGVVALGDSSYGDTYCGAGRQIDALIQQLNANIILPRLDVDAGEYFEPWEAVEPWLVKWVAAL